MIKDITTFSVDELEAAIDSDAQILLSCVNGFIDNETPGIVGTRKYLLNNIKDIIADMELLETELKRR